MADPAVEAVHIASPGNLVHDYRSEDASTTLVCDNFDWRDLRGLGKLLAWSVSISNPSKEHGMNPTAQVAPEKFVETMKDEVEQYAKDVMEAVNKAPDGA